MNEHYYTQPQIDKLYTYSRGRAIWRRYKAAEKKINARLAKECFCIGVLMVAATIVAYSLAVHP